MDANPEVDICMCNGFVDDMTGDEKIMFPNSCSYTIADAKSEFLNLLNTNRLVYLWAKMYRHLALKDFKLNEDVYIGEDRIGCWQLFRRIRKIAIIPYNGYHHVLNNLGLSLNNNSGHFNHPYDLIKTAIAIYEDKGNDEDIQRAATNILFDFSTHRLVPLFIQNKFEVKAADVEPYLKVLSENRSEILGTVPLTDEKKKIIEILAQPFEKARDGCRKIFSDFMDDLKNFYTTYSNIYIYGTGHFGIEVGGWLNNMNCKQYSFLTSQLNAASSQRLEIAGDEKEIIDLPNFNGIPDETGIILAMNARNAKDVSMTLNEKGYKNIFDANKLGIHL